MRFLADEGCGYEVVRALRVAGHDVQAISEMSSRAEDADVIALATYEERIALTEDGDFGQLVYAHGQQTHEMVVHVAVTAVPK